MPCFGQGLDWSHWYPGSARESAPPHASTLTLSSSRLHQDMRDRTPNGLSFIMAWYVAYPISYRQLEEMMGERGVAVDHSGSVPIWLYSPCIALMEKTDGEKAALSPDSSP